MLPLASLLMEPMRPVAIGGLLGHLIYGIILGGGLVMVKRRISRVVPAGEDEPRETDRNDSLRRVSKEMKGQPMNDPLEVER